MNLSMIVLCCSSRCSDAKAFNLSVWHITENYLDQIQPYDVGRFKKVQISLQGTAEQEVYEALDVLDVRRGPYELSELLAMAKPDLRRFALEIIHDVMSSLAKSYAWNQSILERAYDKMKATSLDRIVERNTSIWNRKRSRRALLVGHHSEESFDIYAAVWDKSLDGRHLHKMASTLPVYTYYQPVFGKLRWKDSNVIELISRSGAVVSRLNVESGQVLSATAGAPAERRCNGPGK